MFGRIHQLLKLSSQGLYGRFFLNIDFYLLFIIGLSHFSASPCVRFVVGYGVESGKLKAQHPVL
jgi:hypothetical protein